MRPAGALSLAIGYLSAKSGNQDWIVHRLSPNLTLEKKKPVQVGFLLMSFFMLLLDIIPVVCDMAWSVSGACSLNSLRV